MDVEQIQQIFATTQKQVADLHQKELYVMHGQQSWKESPPKSCTPLHKDIYKPCTAKVYVFSDSVLVCGGKYNILNQQEFGKQDRLCNFVSTPEYRELDNLTREPFVLEWNIFPGPTTTHLLQLFQKLMEDGAQDPPAELRGPHDIRVDVQRHGLDTKEQREYVRRKCIKSVRQCQEVSYGILDFARS